MPRDYMETLLDVFEEILTDHDDFNRARELSLKLPAYFEGETFAVILSALYLTAMVVIDCVEMKCHSEDLYN